MGTGMRAFLFFLAPLLVTGCLTPLICSSENAYEAGERQALSGDPLSLSQGQVCPPENRTEFERAFSDGFKAGRVRLCSREFALEQGKKDAGKGEPSRFPRQKMSSCENMASLEASYDEGYGAAIAAFCAEANARKLGFQAGEGNAGHEDIGRRFGSCPADRLSVLSESYERGYAEGHEVFEARVCSAQAGIQQAEEDARSLSEPRNGAADACSDRTRSEYRRAYTERFLDLKRKSCLEGAAAMGREDLEKRQGADGDGRFPQECPAALRKDFRSLYLQGYCTIDNAFRIGREDGRKGNRAQGATLFHGCPSEGFSFLLESYDRGFHEGESALRGQSEPLRAEPRCEPFDPYQGASGRILKVRVGTRSLVWPNGRTFLYSNAGMKDDGTIYYPNGEALLVRERGLPSDRRAFLPSGQSVDANVREFEQGDVRVRVEPRGAKGLRMRVVATGSEGSVRLFWSSADERVSVEECPSGR